jgi:hypothetical protein
VRVRAIEKFTTINHTFMLRKVRGRVLSEVSHVSLDEYINSLIYVHKSIMSLRDIDVIHKYLFFFIIYLLPKVCKSERERERISFFPSHTYAAKMIVCLREDLPLPV